MLLESATTTRPLTGSVTGPLAAPATFPFRERGGGPGYDPDALALWAAAGVNPSAARKREQSDLIAALKATLDGDGISLWDGFDAFYLFGTGLNDYGGSPNVGDRAFALVNWRRPGTYNCAEVDGANLGFTTDVGFVANADTANLNSNFNPFTALTPKYTQGSAALGVVLSTPTLSNAFAIHDGTRSGLKPRGTSNVSDWGMQSTTFGSSTSIGQSSGLHVVSRRGGLAIDVHRYMDRAELPAASNAGAQSGTVTNATIKILSNGTVRNINKCFAAFIGRGIDLIGVQGVFDAVLG